MKKKRFIGIVTFLSILLLFSLFAASLLGPVKLSPVQAVSVIVKKIQGLPLAQDQALANTLVNLRGPRVILGALIGASLSVCGVAMQALVRNQLADPFILGVSNGAGAFASLDMIFGTFAFLGAYRLSLSASLGALVTMVLVYTLSRSNNQLKISHLLLCGVVISMMMDGLTRFIALAAPNALGMHNAQFWMSGSLAGAKWEYCTLPLVILLLAMILLMSLYRVLNVLSLGESDALTLGVPVKKAQRLLIVLCSVLAGVSIAVSGSIGFIGLMCPHFARLIVGSNHKYVLPVSALLGSLLVVWADVAARILIAPAEIPIGILTALLGGPCFMVMLKKRRSLTAGE